MGSYAAWYTEVPHKNLEAVGRSSMRAKGYMLIESYSPTMTLNACRRRHSNITSNWSSKADPMAVLSFDAWVVLPKSRLIGVQDPQWLALHHCRLLHSSMARTISGNRLSTS